MYQIIVYMFVPSFSITSPSFIAVHLLVSEIANVVPEVVYWCLQELRCLPTSLYVMGFYHFTEFRCSTPSSL